MLQKIHRKYVIVTVFYSKKKYCISITFLRKKGKEKSKYAQAEHV